MVNEVEVRQRYRLVLEVRKGSDAIVQGASGRVASEGVGVSLKK